MIIEFAITNFRSIKNRQVFSMLPSDRVKDRHSTLPLVKGYLDLEVLPLAILYGKNNAGKSNLIKAFHALKWLILNSQHFSIGDSLLANESFAFDEQTKTKPTIFEIDFVASVDDSKVRYLFIIEFNREAVLREELYMYAVTTKNKTTKRKLYARKAGSPIQFGDEFKGLRKPIEDRLTEKKLFLSKAVDENNMQLRPIYEFFSNHMHISNMSEGYIDFQMRYFGKVALEKDGSQKMDALNEALRSIDTGILYLEVSKGVELPDNVRVLVGEEGELNDQERIEKERLVDTLKHQIKAVHKFFDDDKEVGVASIDLEKESEGTRKFIALFTKFMELGATGGVFIVDELERSFHPLLTQVLIQIIANPKINPNNAQLIFTSHDTTIFNMLDSVLNIDQINILEKDIFGATEIYAVSDIRGIRTDIPWQKWYLSGKLEGIPNINFIQITQTLASLYGSQTHRKNEKA